MHQNTCPHNSPSIHRFEIVDLKVGHDKCSSREIEGIIRSDYEIIRSLFDNIAIDGIKIGREIKRLDNGTIRHSERVARFAYLTMEMMVNPTSTNVFDGVLELDDNSKLFYMLAAEAGGLFHDIGKIYFPSDLLTYKLNITIEDREIINQHTKKGFNLFLDIIKNANLPRNIFFLSILDAIRHHHERWDGKRFEFNKDTNVWLHGGYPDNLKGGEISIISRIVKVVDAFDAMTGFRGYHITGPGSLSPHMALAEIKSNRGTQYEGNIVDVFCNVYLKIERINATMLSNDDLTV
ncbi:HD domain-containing protein [Candidatus Micrarchaeota archaeon]|nr:HD domain-containing protein [Candidatus Micrarchaeota archaeon]